MHRLWAYPIDYELPDICQQTLNFNYYHFRTRMRYWPARLTLDYYLVVCSSIKLSIRFQEGIVWCNVGRNEWAISPYPPMVYCTHNMSIHQQFWLVLDAIHPEQSSAANSSVSKNTDPTSRSTEGRYKVILWYPVDGYISWTQDVTPLPGGGGSLTRVRTQHRKKSPRRERSHEKVAS